MTADDGAVLWTASGGSGAIPLVLLECLRGHFGHGRWLLAGHSLGAGLALRYALARPERVLGVLQPLVEALPRGELVILDGVGHLPWLEDPAAFGEVARDFVAERGGSPCRSYRSPAA